MNHMQMQQTGNSGSDRSQRTSGRETSKEAVKTSPLSLKEYVLMYGLAERGGLQEQRR